MVLIRSGLRDSSQRKWLCTESFCAGEKGEGEGARRKEGRKERREEAGDSSTLSPQGGSGTPRLSEVRGPEEIHVPPRVAGGHQSPGSRTRQPFLKMLGTRRCRAQGLTSEALGRQRSHPCFLGCVLLAPEMVDLKFNSSLSGARTQNGLFTELFRTLCKNPDTPDHPPPPQPQGSLFLLLWLTPLGWAFRGWGGGLGCILSPGESENFPQRHRQTSVI